MTRFCFNGTILRFNSPFGRGFSNNIRVNATAELVSWPQTADPLKDICWKAYYTYKRIVNFLIILSTGRWAFWIVQKLFKCKAFETLHMKLKDSVKSAMAYIVSFKSQLAMKNRLNSFFSINTKKLYIATLFLLTKNLPKNTNQPVFYCLVQCRCFPMLYSYMSELCFSCS